MQRDRLLELLNAVRDGAVEPERALTELSAEPFEDVGFAKIDHHRELRKGAAEVIYGAGKTPEQIIGIVSAMRARGGENILITRLDAAAAERVGAACELSYDPVSRVGVCYKRPAQTTRGHIAVACGGTSDIPVAEEAALTAETLGSRVVRLYDVGVAGLHRLLAQMDALTKASAVVAVAGMEGALPSVIGGLVSCPVIAVPTSVGYGASFGGVAALLAMLNSCASGVSVVNIDNGFGAGYLANMINRMAG